MLVASGINSLIHGNQCSVRPISWNLQNAPSTATDNAEARGGGDGATAGLLARRRWRRRGKGIETSPGERLTREYKSIDATLSSPPSSSSIEKDIEDIAVDKIDDVGAVKVMEA